MARFSNRFALALAVAMVLPEMFPVGALGRAAAQVAVPEPKRPADDDAAIPDSIAPAPAVLQAVTAGWMTDDERKDFRVLHGIFDDLDLDTPLRRALVALERWRLDDPALDDASVPRHLKAERWLRVGAHARVLGLTLTPESGTGAVLQDSVATYVLPGQYRTWTLQNNNKTRDDSTASSARYRMKASTGQGEVVAELTPAR